VKSAVVRMQGQMDFGLVDRTQGYRAGRMMKTWAVPEGSREAMMRLRTQELSRVWQALQGFCERVQVSSISHNVRGKR